MANYTSIDFTKYPNNLSTVNVLDIPPADILKLSSLQVTSIGIGPMNTGLDQLNALNSRTDLTADQDSQVRKNIEYITKTEIIGMTPTTASALMNSRPKDIAKYRAQLKIAADDVVLAAQAAALPSNLSDYTKADITPQLIPSLSTTQVNSLPIAEINLLTTEQLTALNTRTDLTPDQINVVKTKLGISASTITPSDQTIAFNKAEAIRAAAVAAKKIADQAAADQAAADQAAADQIKNGKVGFFQSILNWFKKLFGLKSSFGRTRSVNFLLICIIIYMLLVFLNRRCQLGKRTGR